MERKDIDESAKMREMEKKLAEQQKAVDMKWELGDPDIPIGTTEEEFRKT